MKKRPINCAPSQPYRLSYRYSPTVSSLLVWEPQCRRLQQNVHGDSTTACRDNSEDELPNWMKGLGHDADIDRVEKPLTEDTFRKGNVGDWRNHFSADQVKRLKERIELRTRGSDVMDLWKDNGLP
ncbi:sulfotransferase 1C2-like [Ixodes scapularis]